MNFSEALVLMRQSKWLRVRKGRLYTIQDGTIIEKYVNPDAYSEDSWWKTRVLSWEDSPPFSIKDLLSNCWEEVNDL